MKRYILLSFMLITSAINIVAMEIRKNCDVCFEEKESDRFTSLSCCSYNKSCTDCLIDLIKTSLQEKTTAHILCPNRNCAQSITQKDIQVITQLQQDVYKEYDAVAIQEWVDRNTKHCPTPDCKFSFINGATQDFECPQCKHTYCSNCLIKHSTDMTCEQVQIVGNKTKEEAATQKWIMANTKECPACHKLIQKNGGCNHMTCKQCNHEFCWTCGATYRTTRCDSSNCITAQAPNDMDDFNNIIDAQDQANDIPLFIAAQNGNIEIVLLLLNAVPNVDRANFVMNTNNGGHTALELAIRNNNPELVQQLLNAPQLNTNANAQNNRSPIPDDAQLV